MESVLPVLALLACPVGMGVMMFFMARGGRPGGADSAPIGKRTSPSADHPMSLEVLREEHRRLGEEIERLDAPPGDRHDSPQHR